MGRKSAKGKEKKLKRREESTKQAEKQSLVDAANRLEDPMNLLQPFKNFSRNGLNIDISYNRAPLMDKKTLDWAFELTKENMQVLYEQCEWGWSDRNKLEELGDEQALYLLAFDRDRNEHVAMVHFRFELENDDAVLYCYEIQLKKEMRSKGLGRFLMQILELIAYRTQMSKVMLTVFKHNHGAHQFFTAKLKYEMDETSPRDSFEETLFLSEGVSYVILSKKIPPHAQKVVPSVVQANLRTVDSTASTPSVHSAMGCTNCC